MKTDTNQNSLNLLKLSIILCCLVVLAIKYLENFGLQINFKEGFRDVLAEDVLTIVEEDDSLDPDSVDPFIYYQFKEVVVGKKLKQKVKSLPLPLPSFQNQLLYRFSQTKSSIRHKFAVHSRKIPQTRLQSTQSTHPENPENHQTISTRLGLHTTTRTLQKCIPSQKFTSTSTFHRVQSRHHLSTPKLVPILPK